jgi:hypothetical protein
MPTKSKTGGRKKGVPNKSTTLGKELIVSMLNNYSQSGEMTKDFLSLTPKDRLIIAERLMQYILPRMQTTAVDLNMADNRLTIEDRLSRLAGDDDADDSTDA